MNFVVICTDVEGSAPLRATSLSNHRRYVDERASSIVMSGPLVDDDSDLRTGQFYVLTVLNRSEAEAFVANDPFTAAGVFNHVAITRALPKFEFGHRL